MSNHKDAEEDASARDSHGGPHIDTFKCGHSFQCSDTHLVQGFINRVCDTCALEQSTHSNPPISANAPLIAERIPVTRYRVPLAFNFRTGQVEVGETFICPEDVDELDFMFDLTP